MTLATLPHSRSRSIPFLRIAHVPGGAPGGRLRPAGSHLRGYDGHA